MSGWGVTNNALIYRLDVSFDTKPTLIAIVVLGTLPLLITTAYAHSPIVGVQMGSELDWIITTILFLAIVGFGLFVLLRNRTEKRLEC